MELQRYCGRVQASVCKDEPARPVFPQQGWSIKVNLRRRLRHQKRRLNGKAGRQHAANHDVHLCALRSLTEREGLGQAAGFIQLDIHALI